MENQYLYDLWESQTLRVFEPCVRAVIDNPDIYIHRRDAHLEDSCNKAVPIYFLPSPNYQLVANIFKNYILRRWFCPYRTDISREQFLCKFIMPAGLDTSRNTPPPEATIDAVTTFHGIICGKAEKLLRARNDRTKSERRAKRSEKKRNKKKKRNNDWSDDENSQPVGPVCHDGYALRSLYKALIAIASCADYDGENSTTAGRFPIYLVRTGVEDGLSAPISFDAEVAAQRMKYISDDVVETNLEAAVDFIMALEARETAVFGIQPDPASVIVRPCAIPKDKNGRKLTKLPSTQWVSDEKAAEWGWCKPDESVWFKHWGYSRETIALYKDYL
jgi:hypothetical protein